MHAAINFRDYRNPERGPFSKPYFPENTDESGQLEALQQSS